MVKMSVNWSTASCTYIFDIFWNKHLWFYSVFIVYCFTVVVFVITDMFSHHCSILSVSLSACLYVSFSLWMCVCVRACVRAPVRARARACVCEAQNHVQKVTIKTQLTSFGDPVHFFSLDLETLRINKKRRTHFYSTDAPTSTDAQKC